MESFTFLQFKKSDLKLEEKKNKIHQSIEIIEY